MAHKIEKRDINTAIQMHWHGLSNVVLAVTRENSGICYEIEERKLIYVKEHDADGNPVYQDSGSKQLVSLDDNLPIGPAVNDSYTIISNIEVWDLIESSMGGTKHQIVSVGSVKNREIAFASIKIDDNFKAANRITDANLNIIWGHSGKLALIAKTGFTTICCSNTAQMALAERGEFKLSVKHTKNAKAGIANLGKAIENHLGVAREYKEALDMLANEKCTETKAREIFAGSLAPIDKDALLSTRALNTVDRLAELFKIGKGNNGKDFSDVYNSCTDFYSHESSGGENNRWKQFESSEFGSGNNAKTEMFNILINKDRRNEVAKRGAGLLALS